jgi:hypothetical protein
MVSLAIAETFEGAANKAESLRDSALWYPDIPETRLHLNETCFPGINTSNSSEFRPFCYTLFGGATILEPLTKISVLCSGDYIWAIDFHYDTGNIQRLGHQPYKLSSCDTLYFLIDGAGGEIIETIEVDLKTSLAHPEGVGKLRSFQVSDCLPRPNCTCLIQAIIPLYLACSKLRLRRSLPIEDDRNIFMASCAR